MFRQRGRGGYGHRCDIWNLSLSPLWGFWLQILPQTAVLVSLERDNLSNLNYIPVPRVENLTKNLQKNSNATPKPLQNIHTGIINCLHI